MQAWAHVGTYLLIFRMCLVEVEKSAKPVAACAMPVMNVSDRGPTEDIIHYFTLMSSELHYLDIIPKIENLH